MTDVREELGLVTIAFAQLLVGLLKRAFALHQLAGPVADLLFQIRVQIPHHAVLGLQLVDHRVEVPGQLIDFVGTGRPYALGQVARLDGIHRVDDGQHARRHRTGKQLRKPDANAEGDHRNDIGVVPQAVERLDLVAGRVDDLDGPLHSERADHQCRDGHDQPETELQPHAETRDRIQLERHLDTAFEQRPDDRLEPPLEHEEADEQDTADTDEPGHRDLGHYLPRCRPERMQRQADRDGGQKVIDGGFGARLPAGKENGFLRCEQCLPLVKDTTVERMLQERAKISRPPQGNGRRPDRANENPDRTRDNHTATDLGREIQPERENHVVRTEATGSPSPAGD